MSFFSQHKLIIILVAIVVAGGAWYMLSGSSAPPPNLVVSGQASIGGVAPADQGLVATLLQLRAVKLDGTILGNPAFVSLKDFSTQIVPESVGRPDPFAPLSSRAAASASAAGTPSAQIFTPRR